MAAVCRLAITLVTIRDNEEAIQVFIRKFHRACVTIDHKTLLPVILYLRGKGDGRGWGVRASFISGCGMKDSIGPISTDGSAAAEQLVRDPDDVLEMSVAATRLFRTAWQSSTPTIATARKLGA